MGLAGFTAEHIPTRGVSATQPHHLTGVRTKHMNGRLISIDGTKDLAHINNGWPGVNILRSTQSFSILSMSRSPFSLEGEDARGNSTFPSNRY